MIVPIPRQLLYVRDQHKTHAFFRTFGRDGLVPTTSTTTREIGTTASTSTTTLSSTGALTSTDASTSTGTSTTASTSTGASTTASTSTGISTSTGTTVTVRPARTDSSGFWGFTVLLVIPLAWLVLKRRRGRILPFRIHSQRFFNAIYDDGEMEMKRRIYWTVCCRHWNK